MESPRVKPVWAPSSMYPVDFSWLERCKYQASDSKCFRICTNPFHIYENFEGSFVDTLKRQNSQTSLQPVWTMPNLSTFTKEKSHTSWRIVFAHLGERQNNDLNSTDLVKKTVSQSCLWRGQSRPMKVGHLASHEPKRVLASVKGRSH